MNKKKVVVITGAGSGIGEATALAFAKLGYSIHLTDINPGALDNVSEKLKGLPCSFQTYQIDCRKSEKMEAKAQIESSPWNGISKLPDLLFSNFWTNC